MKHKISVFFISIAMAMALVPAGTCAGLPSKSGKTPCENKMALDFIITTPAPEGCHVTSCPAKQRTLFVLPDTSWQRPNYENRSFTRLPAIPADAQTAAASPPFWAARLLLKQPLSFHPPPLFSLCCVYIC